MSEWDAFPTASAGTEWDAFPLAKAPAESGAGPRPITMAVEKAGQFIAGIPSAVTQGLESAGKTAHGLMTGQIPPTPENVLPAAAMATPMGAGRQVASKAARTLLERQQDVTGVYLPRAVDSPGKAGMLSAIPFAGGPLHKAKARTEAGLSESGALAAREAAYPAGKAAAKGLEAESMAETVLLYGQSPEHIQSLARLRGSVPPDAWGNFQSHAIQRMGGPGKSFDPTVFRDNYGALTPEGKTILFGTKKDPLRFHLDAIEEVSRRSASWAPFQPPGGKWTKGGVLGYAMTEPITALSAVITGRTMAKYLASPATAAPIAQWSRAVERVARSGGAPAAMAGFKMATDNLRNSLGENFSDEDLIKAMTKGAPSRQQAQRVTDEELGPLEGVVETTSRLAPRGIPWEKMRRSQNVETRGDPGILARMGIGTIVPEVSEPWPDTISNPLSVEGGYNAIRRR